MPRQPRLDAPDTLHHVMVRGLERRATCQNRYKSIVVEEEPYLLELVMVDALNLF